MGESVFFLTFEIALEVHEDQIARYGGSSGIRDEGLLRSALAQPAAEFGGKLLHPTIEAKAGAYLFHLVKNHPFVDGNKRVGAACCLVFLDQNGFELDPALLEAEADGEHTFFERVVLDVASGQMSKDELISFIREHLCPV